MLDEFHVYILLSNKVLSVGTCLLDYITNYYDISRYYTDKINTGTPKEFAYLSFIKRSSKFAFFNNVIHLRKFILKKFPNLEQDNEFNK